MSLLLDALQRASKDKAVSAGLATPTQVLKLDKSVRPAATFPDLTLSPAAEPELLPEKPALSPEPTLEPVPEPTPEPALELTLEPTPRQPQTSAAIVPPIPSAPAAPPDDALAKPLSAPPPEKGPEQAPVATKEAAAKPAESTDRIAQEIRRAYVQPQTQAATHHRRTLILGGSALVLALALGSVFLGLWGEPEKLLGTLYGQSTITPTQPPTLPPTQPLEQPLPAAEPTPESAPMPAPPVSTPMLASPPSRPASTPPSPPQRAASAVKRAAVPAPQTKSVAPAARATPVQPVVPPVFSARLREPGALERAYAALQAGQIDDAEHAYTQAIQSNPDERDALLGMAYISHRKGQIAAAQAYYRKVLRQEPGNAIAQAGLLALDTSSDATLSASRARELAALQPDSAAAHNMLGNTLVRDGLLADAAQAFSKAQALEPNNPLHAYNHAVARDRLGQYAQAIHLYEKVWHLVTKSAGNVAGISREVVQRRIEQLQQMLENNGDAAP